MSTTYVQHTLQTNNRADIRNELVTLLLQKQPGTGAGVNASRYRYTVDTFNNYYSIVLNRPVGLNKGFDFTVNIQGMSFKKQRTYSNPSHQDIIDVLKSVKNINPTQYQNVSLEFRYIYNCVSPKFQNVSGITFLAHTTTPRPIEIILVISRTIYDILEMVRQKHVVFKSSEFRISMSSKKVKRWHPENFELEMTTHWTFPNRGNWATYDAKWRGNWSPYIPRNIMLIYSQEGDLVLDQFAGGETTLVEAKLLNRDIIGVDVNDVALDRCHEKTAFELDGANDKIYIKRAMQEIYFLFLLKV